MKTNLLIILLGIYLIGLGVITYETYQTKKVAHSEQKVEQFFAQELEKKFYTP